jgi:hypothetical protein
MSPARHRLSFLADLERLVTPPELVVTEEWRTHAETWRKCINVDHGPTCQSNPRKLANGDLFKPAESDGMGLTDLAARVYQLWGS